MAKAASLTLIILLLVCATYAAAQEIPTAAPGEWPEDWMGVAPSQVSESASSLEPSQVQAQGNPAAGLDEACKKTPDPPYCGLFLQPYAAVFAGNDPKKMGFAAINATLGQVKATKSFFTREALNDKTSNLHSAMMTCVGRIARGEGSLKMAARELNCPPGVELQRKIHKADPKKMVDTATTEFNACLDVLQKATAGGGGGDNNMVQAALRKVKDSIIACSVAKSLIQ